jgi:hypothetical protein
MFRPRIALTILPLPLLVPLATSAACDPKGVFRIVTANISPGIAKLNFAAQPKTRYRSGRFLALMLVKSDKVVSAIGYRSCLSRPDIDAALFAKPDRIEFVEH